MQHGWSSSLRQSPNQRPRTVQHKDTAIIVVPLLGHADRLQTSTQPLCEHCCTLVVLSPVRVVVIGNWTLPIATINEQQRPVGAPENRIRSTCVVHWHEQKVGCIVTIHIYNALEGGEHHVRRPQAQLIVGDEGIDQPRPGGEVRIVPLQVLHQQFVIPQNMLVTQPFPSVEHPPAAVGGRRFRRIGGRARKCRRIMSIISQLLRGGRQIDGIANTAEEV